MYITQNNHIEESHPWPPFIPPGANKLILGTFPTAVRNRKGCEFYYPNPNNDFWKVIFKVAGRELKDFIDHDPVIIRKQVLTELKLGIADMGKRILRHRDSSSDGSIFPIQFTDVFLLLEQQPDIQKVIITSSSGTNNVLSWFEHYCKLNAVKLNFQADEAFPKYFTFMLVGKTVQGTIIPSASRQSRYKGEKLVPFYEKALLDK
jgi:G:T/U-mismatch repair DNA glycosylase